MFSHKVKTHYVLSSPEKFLVGKFYKVAENTMIGWDRVKSGTELEIVDRTKDVLGRPLVNLKNLKTGEIYTSNPQLLNKLIQYGHIVKLVK